MAIQARKYEISTDTGPQNPEHVLRVFLEAYHVYVRSTGHNNYFLIFFKLDTDIPFSNPLDKFVGKNNLIILPSIEGGGVANKFGVLGPQGVFFKHSPLSCTLWES